MPPLNVELSIREIVNDLEEFNIALGDTYDEEDSELVDMAQKLLASLNKINNNTACFNEFSIEAKIKIISGITAYKVIMTPSTGLMFRYTLCCTKKKRQRKHEAKCALSMVHLIEAKYLLQVYDVRYKCDVIVRECHDAQKFADVLRQISSTTSIFEIKNTLESKSLSKEKLSVLLSRLEVYKEEFLPAKGEDRSRSSAMPTRFRNVKTALATSPSSSGSYVGYKKANKMLYDMAALGTSLLIFKIDENLKIIEDHVKKLQTVRTEEMTEFSLLEVDGTAYNLIDERVIVQTKSDSEHIEGVTHAKLVGAAFEWSELKQKVSSESFLSSFFGSADDDIENMFSSASFMASPGLGSNLAPKQGKSSVNVDSVVKGAPKNVSEFFTNIKLPNNKKPPRNVPPPCEEQPVYNLKTKQLVDTRGGGEDKLIHKKPVKKSAVKKYSSEDYLSAVSQPTPPAKKMATSFEPLPSAPAKTLSESFTLGVIDFEDTPSPAVSSSGLLSDSSSDSLSSQGHSRAASQYRSKLNSKLTQMSGSISRTASKASAKVSETKEKVSEKVATSAPRRILKNSYTSLKNKTDAL